MRKPRASGAFSFGGEGDLDESPRFDDWARTAQSDAGAQRRRRAAARARMARVDPSFSAMIKPRTSGAFSFGGEGDLDESPRFDRSAGRRSARAQRVRRTRPRDGPRNPSFSAMIKPRTSGAFSLTPLTPMRELIAAGTVSWPRIDFCVNYDLVVSMSEVCGGIESDGPIFR